VVGGTALAFMAVTYYVLPLIFRRRVAFWGLAKAQPYIFGLGIVILSMSMIFQGIFGVPRRHWDVSFSNAPFQVEYHPAVQLFQATMGIGGLLAILGGLAYIVIAVVTVFFGRPFRPDDRGDPSGVPPGVWSLPKQVHDGASVAAIHRTGTPGTVVLVLIFFAGFILYYFANWKILSFLWKVG
jgi:cytochrome c oxidase subunit 1